MASNGHFNIRFCTVTVNIYRLLKRNYGIGDQSFRTVTVDIYLYKKRIKKIIDNAVFVQYLLIFIKDGSQNGVCLSGFRTVSVDIYQIKELKEKLSDVFSYSIC